MAPKKRRRERKNMEKKVIVERNNRASHAYAVEAWSAIHKILADVILIKEKCH